MSSDSSGLSFTILVIDDEPPICDLLSRLAKQEFPEAAFVNTRSVQETWDYLDEHASKLPQLVLLDIDLREAKNGLDLLPQLRQRFQGQVPIIVLSATAKESAVEQAYDQGAVAYTQKPEELAAWRAYVRQLRTYWHQTSRLPNLPPDDPDFIATTSILRRLIELL